MCSHTHSPISRSLWSISFFLSLRPALSRVSLSLPVARHAAAFRTRRRGGCRRLEGRNGPFKDFSCCPHLDPRYSLVTDAHPARTLKSTVEDGTLSLALGSGISERFNCSTTRARLNAGREEAEGSREVSWLKVVRAQTRFSNAMQFFFVTVQIMHRDMSVKIQAGLSAV